MNKATILTLLCLSLAFGFAFAQSTSEPIDLGASDLPIASIDNIFIPFANPSLLGTTHARGVGWAQVIVDRKLQKHYWLIANMEGISYLYENNERTSNHTIGWGTEVFPAHLMPNLYMGTAYKWTNDKYAEGALRSGVTYRPLNAMSFAMTWDNPHKAAPQYRFGAAIRPLALATFVKDHRVELSADFNYVKDSQTAYEFQKPTLGFNTELLNGIGIGGTYNMENEGAMLNFSISTGKRSIGSFTRVQENANTYSVGYVHLTDQAFAPFLGLNPKHWYSMRMPGEIVTYKSAKYSFGPFQIFEGKQKSIEQVIAEITQAKNDPTIEGILFTNPSFATSFALMQELLGALKDFKSAGKKVEFYFDNISNGGYIFAASIADNIYLNPMGTVDLRGLSITSPYLKSLLDSMGIDVLNFRSHKYKTAANMFSETEMTPAEREVYDSILQSIMDNVIAQISSGRGERFGKPVKDIIDEGPYFLAKDAHDAGLVDKLIYQDELEKTIKESAGFSRKKSVLEDYRDYSWAKPKEKQIAVIYATGNIVMGKGAAGKMIAHDTTVKLIRAARNNKDYKGIILRVDSGGGSAQASDIILRELQLAQSKNKKPVVVSMTGVAGSGGYYIACGADRIIAQPTTITGSIGVVGLAFNLERLMEKIRVNWSTVKKGENADFGSLYRAWSEEEKALMEYYIEEVYEDFVRKVDAGRKNLSLEEVHQFAQGRVWTGEQAKAIGLIDDLGGLDKAIEHMRELTGIKGKIKLVDATTSCKKGVVISMKSNPLAVFPGFDLVNDVSSEYIELYELWKNFRDENAMMLSPLNNASVKF
ncbi:MAG: signal peptide peptidase SppA [Candidatus Cloacimonadaceae bacterium]|nr:signal peptide peptidase SppA [Candidatus Cloacimonadaceae bacterium]